MAKEKKYASVVKDLPRLLGGEPAYRDKVDAVKASIVVEQDFDPSASARARAYAVARVTRDAIKEELYEAQLVLEAATELMTERFELEGVDSVRLSGGRPVSAYLEPYAQIMDHGLFHAFCVQDPDLERKMTLPWQVTNAITKERLENGDPQPPGIKVFAKTKVRFGAE